MAMIIDATAKYGIRGAIRSLLSPQSTSSDCNERSTPQYVCARKRYESERKGRICVYRIGDERTDSGGRKVKVELQRLDVKPCDLSDDGSDRRSKSDGTAPS